jgi:hypothetical protein
LSLLPYLVGYETESENWRFSGFVLGVEDENSYIAKMLRGSEGDWLFRTPYTSLDQRGALAFLPYLLLGKLASGEARHEQLVALFHLFRLAVIPLLVHATYLLVSTFEAEIGLRRWATALATIGGGFGWVLMLLHPGAWLGNLPLEFYSPEAFGLLSVLAFPHLILARALLLYALTLYLRPSSRSSWAAGCLLLVLTVVQPLTVLTAYAVMGAHLLVAAAWLLPRGQKAHWLQWVRAGVRSVLPSLPVVIYLFVSFSLDPFLRLWTEQNVIPSPHPAHYVLAYGAFALPAVAGMKIAWRRGPQSLLVAGWLLIFPFLAYAPHNLQRRLPDGTWVAVVCLAAMAVGAWRTSGRIKAVAIRAMLLVSLPSSAFLWILGVGVALDPRPPAFLDAAKVAAFEWLAGHGREGSVVLTGFRTGTALPAYAPVRVVIGHGAESIGLESNVVQVESFYRGAMTEAEQMEFLKEHKVAYVFYGSEERANSERELAPRPYLQSVYDSDGYEIYVVTQSP